MSVKTYGIITNDSVKRVFDQINMRFRCDSCKEKRNEIKVIIKKNEMKNNSYSNLIPGFSSEEINIPLDLLIIAQSHGGGRNTDFRLQKPLTEEVEYIANYYLHEKIVKYHQKKMREMLEWIKKQNIEYVFTDLVKCYVWRTSNKQLRAISQKNFETAIKHCQKYLEQQIEVLQPKIILALGRQVNELFNITKPISKAHGECVQEEKGTYIIRSIFPSRNTVDTWVANGEWIPIKNQISKIIHVLK